MALPPCASRSVTRSDRIAPSISSWRGGPHGQPEDEHLLPIGPRDALAVSGGLVTSESGGRSVVRLAATAPGTRVSAGDGKVTWEAELPAGGSISLDLHIPFVPPQSAEDVSRLASLDFDRALSESREAWREECARGCTTKHDGGWICG